MKKTMIKIALAVLVGIVPISTASAATITYDSINAGDGSVVTTAVAGATFYDFDTDIPTFADGSNYQIVTGSASGQYAAPAIDTDKDTTDYLSIPENLNDSPVSATIDFNSLQGYLGLFWGSIDTYNSITFFNDDVLLFTVTGSDVAQPNATGNQSDPGTNRYVNIFSYDKPFDSVTFTSTSMAFEIDNLAVAPVPEPATMLLFGTGLVGLVGIARRRKNSKI